MTCAVCGAAADRSRSHCAICGYAVSPEAADTGRKWDRGVEAEAFTDLQQTLESHETLLGATRGRIAGTWKRRFSFHPQALLSPYINLGLTSEKLLLQQVQPGTGRALTDKASEILLADVQAFTVSDADPLEAGRTARLVVQLKSGDSFRLRASGRLADRAQELVAVWDALQGAKRTRAASVLTCPHCNNILEKPSRFCPLCGEPTDLPSPFDPGTPPVDLSGTHAPTGQGVL